MEYIVNLNLLRLSLQIKYGEIWNVLLMERTSEGKLLVMVQTTIYSLVVADRAVDCTDIDVACSFWYVWYTLVIVLILFSVATPHWVSSPSFSVALIDLNRLKNIAASQPQVCLIFLKRAITGKSIDLHVAQSPAVFSLRVPTWKQGGIPSLTKAHHSAWNS